MKGIRGGAFLALALALLFLAPAVKADPTVTTGGQGSLDVVWDFQSPANYTTRDVELQGGEASLRRIPGGLNFTTQSDFADNATLANIDLTRRPGDVVLNRTSGPSATATYTSKLVGDGNPVSWKAIAWNASSFDDHSDEFGGTSLDPHWRWLNPPASYTVGPPRPGWLTFNTLRPTDFWNGAASGQFLYQSVSGEFQVEVHLQTSPLAAAGQKAGLLVMLPPPFSPTTFWGSVDRVLTGGIVRVQAATTYNGNTYVNTTITANPDYFMIRRTANGSLETYYGSDGRNWTFLTNVGFGNPPVTLWVGVFSGNPSGVTPMTMNVDYVRFSFPGASTQMQLETRTGNATNTTDPSWTPWSFPHANPLGSPIGRGAGYLQYRLLLSTNSLYVRPLVGDVNLSWEYRPSTGEVATQEFSLGRPLVWDVLALEMSPRGGTVTVSYALNSSAPWSSIQPGAPNITVSGKLRLRLKLVTPDPSRSPSVTSLRVGLRPEPAPLAPPAAFPFWLVLIPLVLFPAFLLVTRMLRGPFRATDLFLIHTDGRLVFHVGGRHVLIRDEIAASGMFTLVARFVKDSFGASGGTGGELKSLKVDEREVAIAKGGYLFLALVAQGPRPKHLDGAMTDFLGGIEGAHRTALEAWDGLSEGLGELGGQLAWFLRKGHRRAHPALPGRYYRT